MTPLPPFSEAYLTSWTVAWAANIVMAVASAAYLVGWSIDLRRTRRRHAGLLLAWLGAMAGLVIGFDSSIGMYSDSLFWIHMVQHLTLIMVVPPLLVWSDPGSLIPVGRDGRTVADVLDGSRVWRALTNPAAAVPMYAAAVVLTHLTSFQQTAVGSGPIRALENTMYLVVGLLLFARLLAPGSRPHRVPDLVAFVVLAAAMGVDTLTGVVLMMTNHPLAPGYAASHPGWPPGAMTDQDIAGALMWFAGDGIMMLLMIIVGVAWGMRRDSGLSSWLDAARQREVLGDGWVGPAGDDPDIDVEQAALDAYNARLALINEHDVSARTRTPTRQD